MNFILSSASSSGAESILPAFPQTMRPNSCLATRLVAASQKFSIVPAVDNANGSYRFPKTPRIERKIVPVAGACPRRHQEHVSRYRADKSRITVGTQEKQNEIPEPVTTAGVAYFAVGAELGLYLPRLSQIGSPH